MAWILNLTCSGPGELSSDQNVSLEWLIYILFSSCSQQLLLTALHVCFLLVVSITATVTRLKRKLQTSISTTPSSSKHYRTRSISLLYISTLTLLSINALLALALCAWHVYSSCTTSWTSSSIAQVVFSACQALACTAFPLIVAHHLAYNPTLHPTSIRLWWFLTSILSIFQFCSAVIRLASSGLSYSSFLIADDFFSIVSFPISLFLLVVSVNGSSGLSTSSTDPSTEPLLNGSQSDENNKKQQLPITPYYTASLFSKSMWLWLNPLLSKGYKTTLQIEDVPELAPDDRAERLYDLLQSNWPEFKTDHPVRSALLRSFRGSLSFTAVLAFTKAVSSYAGPVMIQSFVDFLDTDTRYYIEGYALVFILLVAKSIEVLSTHHYQFLSQKLGMTIRSCLITTIYRKGLRLSTSSRQSHGAGRIVNYMTVDVQQINDSIVQVHNIWVLPLQVVLALLILYREIGLSMLAGFVTMILLTGFISYNSRLLRRYSMEVMMKKDARMRATTEVLNYMKIIKLQAWEEYFRKRVEDYRLTEYGSIKWFQLALTSNITVLSVSTSIVCIITFGTCLLLNVSLTSAKVFTVISTFNILAEPIRTFPQAIIAVSQALVSVDRLDKFMLSKEIGDYVVRGPRSKSEFSVSVEGGNFTWDEDKATPMLHDINVKVPHGYLVAIVGTVGGGKSSLLAALLGEMPKLSGTVQVNGTTAYVPQTAWIQSGTVEENILFGTPMDRARYRRTIKSCCLEQDLELLEFGDQTEIGERGINLSGGQKQRVQLARAVYQSSDIYYLDDVFSAVDAHTGSAIFKDCLLGILHNKTRILVTHQVEFLHKADLILVVQDGAIQQSGKYSDLVKAGAEFGALIAAHKKSLGSVEVDEAGVGSLNDEWNESFGESGKLLVRSGSGSLSNSQENLLKQRSSSSFASSAGDVAGKLVEEEKRESGRVGWNVYWLFLTNAYGPFFFLIVVIIQAIAQGFSIGSDFWLSYETSESSFSAAEFMRVYSLLCLGNWVFTAIRGVLMCMFSLKTSQTFYLGMLKSIFRAPMSFFDTTPTGRILTRASTDQATLDILLPLSFVLAMMLYASTLGVVVVACVITWPIVFAVLPLAWVYFRYQAFYINSSREITRLDSVTKAPVIHHFTETIAGFLVIRGFGKEEEFAITNVNRVNTNLKMDFHFNASNDWLGFRLEIIGAVVLCVAAFLLIVLPSSVITPASAALSLSYGFSLNSVLAASVFFSCTIENKMVAVERIGQFTRLPSEAPLVIEGRVPHKDWPQRGNISIRDLLVRYQPTMPLVLKGISLDIIGGQKIGVVGRTGSGKSTLIQVLFRIVEPAGGVIKFDEVDITSVGLHDLRSKLGIIPQDPVLFEGTIRTNMDPLGVHTEAEIWEGIRKCQLADVVEARDEKLDAVVADNGENFSVGQRQLLCLGRALLKKSHILFLDEATASVDTQTDAVLQTIIREEFQSCTVISIAHRIPTVMDCDKVMVLEAGLLKEYDSPARLLEHPSTLFAALVREYTTRSEG